MKFNNEKRWKELLVTNEMLKLSIEIISNLVYIKNQMYNHILKPVGVNQKDFEKLLKVKNIDGKLLTKREIGITLLEEVKNPDLKKEMVVSVIRIGAHWNKYHLSDNEYKARATVQKAREILNIIDIMQEKDEELLKVQKLKESQKAEELMSKIRKQKENEIIENSKLLLLMFDNILMVENNAQKKGYMLEELINMLFQLYDISLLQSFRRNSGGEQIDGAIKLDGWHYIVEMKWTSQLTDMRQLDSLYGKVARSGKQTMGLFISINGWSSNVIPLMKQNPDKSIILIDGIDLRAVLSNQISLIELLQKKIAKFNLETLPFIGVASLL